MNITHNNDLFFENKKNTIKKTKQLKNVVKKSDALSNNEIKIKNELTKIPYFFLYFDTLLSNKIVKIAEIDDEKFEKCEIRNNTIDYYLFQYENREKLEKFANFIKELVDFKDDNKSPNKKKYVLKMIHSFKNLLKMTNMLNDSNIIHLNIVPQTILIKEDESLFLTNFAQGFILNKEDLERNDVLENLHFSSYDPRRIHLPLEVHLFCFMKENKYESISSFNIETVINEWFRAISLSPLKKYITEDYKESALFSLRFLINKSKNVIKHSILCFAPTWNNYSTSIIFLYILSSLDERLYCYKFIDGFSKILLKNISANPMKRENELTTDKLFDEMLYSITQKEWN
jgi:hypothetical protein